MKWRTLEEQQAANDALIAAVKSKGGNDEIEARIKQAIANGGNPNCSVPICGKNKSGKKKNGKQKSISLHEYCNYIPGKKGKMIRELLFDGRSSAQHLEGTWEEIQEAKRKICTHGNPYNNSYYKADQDKGRTRNN